MNIKVKKGLLLFGFLLIPLAVQFSYDFIEEWKLDRALGPAREIKIFPRRGRLLAADGSVIALTDTSHSFHVDCIAMPDSGAWVSKAKESAPGLDRLFPRKDTSGWLPVLLLGRQQQKRYLPIADSLEKEQVDSIKALALFSLVQGGAIIETRPVRVHPFGSLAGATIGTIREDMQRSGLEETLDYTLFGVEGRQVIRKGRYEGRYVEKVVWHLPVRNGNDVTTSILMRQQVSADSVLRSVMKDTGIGGGCLVVMSAETGAIRAIVNLTRTEHGIDEIENIAVRRAIEPGRIGDAISYAASLAQKQYGEDPQAYIDRMHAFLPDFEFELDMVKNQISTSVEGIRVSPLSLLTFFNGIAKQGRMIPPYLVEKIVDEEGCVLTQHKPTICGEIPEAVAESLAQWIESVGSNRNKKKRQGVTRLSGASQEAATCVALPGDGSEYSIICALLTSALSRGESLAEKAVQDLIDILE